MSHADANKFKPKNLAFPRTASAFKDSGGNNVIMDYGEEGMTLRDYFAAKAMEALIAQFNRVEVGMVHSNVIASDSYIIADSMLKARDK